MNPPVTRGSPRKSKGFDLTIGWREWVALPDLGLPAIKAKIDTGARTSALHAFYVEPFTSGGQPRVRFGIHPLQRRKSPVLHCEAPLLDRRRVSDSGGHHELRYVIETSLTLGPESWPIEVTLTNRDTMVFRMLIGRTGLPKRTAIEPAKSYLTGRLRRSHVERLYAGSDT